MKAPIAEAEDETRTMVLTQRPGLTHVTVRSPFSVSGAMASPPPSLLAPSSSGFRSSTASYVPHFRPQAGLGDYISAPYVPESATLIPRRVFLMAPFFEYLACPGNSRFMTRERGEGFPEFLRRGFLTGKQGWLSTFLHRQCAFSI
jgi:hypothetical protein